MRAIRTKGVAGVAANAVSGCSGLAVQTLVYLPDFRDRFIFRKMHIPAVKKAFAALSTLIPVQHFPKFVHLPHDVILRLSNGFPNLIHEYFYRYDQYA